MLPTALRLDMDLLEDLGTWTVCLAEPALVEEDLPMRFDLDLLSTGASSGTCWVVVFAIPDVREEDLCFLPWAVSSFLALFNEKTEVQD